MTVTRYDVTVWDIMEGDIRERQRAITDQELDQLHEQYGDDPLTEIVVDDCWEGECDDEE